MDQGHWTLVETLGPRTEWSALAVDRRTAQWKSLARALPVGVLPVAEEAHTAAARVDRELPASRSRPEGNYASATPIFGPDGVVHGLTVYVGHKPAPVTPLRPVAGYCFCSTDRVFDLVRNTVDWFPGDTTRARLTMAEAFHHVERFDGAMELLPDLLSPVADTRWAGRLTVRIAGTARNLHVALKNGIGGELAHWRGLVHDITDIVPPEQIPLDTAILAALRNREPRNSYLALVDTTQLRLVRWITQPIPELAWHGTDDIRPAAHPEDVARFFTEGPSLNGIRMRRVDGGWIIVNSTATMVPTPGLSELMLMEFEITGYSEAE